MPVGPTVAVELDTDQGGVEVKAGADDDDSVVGATMTDDDDGADQVVGARADDDEGASAVDDGSSADDDGGTTTDDVVGTGTVEGVVGGPAAVDVVVTGAAEDVVGSAIDDERAGQSVMVGLHWVTVTVRVKVDCIVVVVVGSWAATAAASRARRPAEYMVGWSDRTGRWGGLGCVGDVWKCVEQGPAALGEMSEARRRGREKSVVAT